MVEIKEILDADEKANICNKTLRALPSWFGIEESIVEYVNEVRNMPFYAAVADGGAIGFVAVKLHNQCTAEVYVMGILEGFHRHGIGKRLIGYCEDYCRNRKMEFLTVKTLADTRESESYKKTRMFYQSAGFKPLEVFPTIWGEANPCLFLVKHLEYK